MSGRTCRCSRKGKTVPNISWKSSDPAVVSDTTHSGIDDPFPGGGVVKRPGVGEDPVNVTLTATITMDGVPGELTKEFDLTITPLSEGRGTPSHENARYLFTFYAEGYDWDEDGETTEEMYFAISPDASQWRTLNLKTRPDGSHYTEPIFQSTMATWVCVTRTLFAHPTETGFTPWQLICTGQALSYPDGASKKVIYPTAQLMTALR